MATQTNPELTQEMTVGEFLRWFQGTWEQGEHVTLIGPTGTGKTTFAKYLLRFRDYVTMFNSKGKDTSADKFLRTEGFVRQDRWDGSRHDRIMLWPKLKKGEDPESLVAKQYHAFNRSITDMYHQGGWTIYLDEVSYLSDFLRMERRLRWMLQQFRSENMTIVAATQRPAFIPLAFYDQPSHLFMWADNDETNLKRIKGIGGQNGREIRDIVQSLGHREVLYVHTRHPYERIRFLIKL